MSSIVMTVINSSRATLYELQTVYGLQDLWDLFEIQAVGQHNENLAMKDANNR